MGGEGHQDSAPHSVIAHHQEAVDQDQTGVAQDQEAQ